MAGEARDAAAQLADQLAGKLAGKVSGRLAPPPWRRALALAYLQDGGWAGAGDMNTTPSAHTR